MFRAIKDVLSEPRDTTSGGHRHYHEHRGHEHVGTTAGATAAPSSLPTSGFSQPQVKEHATVVERREAAPVVHERIFPTEKVEVIPYIHRERELLEVRELTQKIIEKGTLPQSIREETLPEERREATPISMDLIEEKLRKAKEGLAPSSHRENTVRTVEEKPAIVTEDVKKKILEELVPVVERYITEPHLIYEKKHIYEKIFEEPIFVHKELPTIERPAQLEAAGGRGGEGFERSRRWSSGGTSQLGGGQFGGGQGGGSQYSGEYGGGRYGRESLGQYAGEYGGGGWSGREYGGGQGGQYGGGQGGQYGGGQWSGREYGGGGQWGQREGMVPVKIEPGSSSGLGGGQTRYT